MKRNIIRPLEASAILDGLADLADQVVSQLLGGNAVPLRASAAPDDPDAGNSRDWSRETVSAEVRSIETIGARLWAFGRTFRRGFSELVAFLRDHEFVALDFGGLDRKRTRLNSSHRCISYAVFSLLKTISLFIEPHAREAWHAMTAEPGRQIVG